MSRDLASERQWRLRDDPDIHGPISATSPMTKFDSSPSDLPDWLRGDPVAEDMHARGLIITKAAWLDAAYGSSNESVLAYDKDMREWVRRHFPVDPHEPVR